MYNFPNIKVVEGNAFSVLIPLKRRTFESMRPIDEDIDATQLTDVVVKFGGVEYAPSLGEDGVRIDLPATLARGTYDIVLTADYQGSEIRAAYESAISIVAWNSQSDAQQFVPGSPIVCEAAYIIGGALTDAELEALKEEYREKNAELALAIQAAEEAKEAWERQAEQLTGVAQQGTNPDATNTAILTAVQQGGGTDVAKESTSQTILTKIGSAAQGQPSTLFEAIGDVALSSQTLQSLADSWAAMVTNRNSLAGYTFIEGESINGVGDIIAKATLLKTVNDPTITTIIAGTFVSLSNLVSIRLDNLTSITVPSIRLCSHLTSLTLPNLQTITSSCLDGLTSLERLELPKLETINTGSLSGCTNLKELILPRLTTFANSFLQNCTNLRYLYMPSWAGQAGGFASTMSGCVKLIDIVTGGALTNNQRFDTWSPTEALRSDVSTLVDEGETFSNNLEKLLYNIREHIAANLPDRTGLSALTLTFSAAVKAAIQGDTATAQAFSNKNWNVA